MLINSWHTHCGVEGGKKLGQKKGKKKEKKLEQPTYFAYWS